MSRTAPSASSPSASHAARRGDERTCESRSSNAGRSQHSRLAGASSTVEADIACQGIFVAPVRLQSVLPKEMLWVHVSLGLSFALFGIASLSLFYARSRTPQPTPILSMPFWPALIPSNILGYGR